MLIGAVVGTPGASYITALHQLITSKSSTATQAIAVVIFAIIEFALVIVPFTFLELRPESTRQWLKVAQGWITGHARQLIAIAVIIAGTYMTVTGLIRLSEVPALAPLLPTEGTMRGPRSRSRSAEGSVRLIRKEMTLIARRWVTHTG